MHAGRIVFAQLMDFLPMHQFKRCAWKKVPQSLGQLRSVDALDPPHAAR